MASGRNGTLYLGVTSNLARRVYEHKNKIYEGFSKQYATGNLVYYEVHQNVESAITREKQLKRWNRKWKIRLIEEKNPYWHDLYEKMFGERA